MHTLESSIFAKAPLTMVWDFFSDPRNLVRITPPQMRLTPAPGTPARTEAGTLLEFQLSLFGLPLRWKSLIEVWEPRRFFVDRQVSGPYSFWRHEHRFEAVEGGTWIRDRVEYQMPLGPLGLVAHRFSVRRMLDRLFTHRGAEAVRLLEVDSARP